MPDECARIAVYEVGAFQRGFSLALGTEQPAAKGTLAV